ncbi:MAG: dihydrodipicolinate synthase family protein [Rhodospirillales bacterium]|nr:dihydrodipicolinate synthase family protein [Rhodospirillales bacterium]
MAAKPLDETARGVYIISATPFTEAGDIDFDSTDRLVDFYLDGRVDGIVILGVMGEAPKLSAAESLEFAERVLKHVNGRVQVVVGVSSAGNLNLKRLTDKVMTLGAAGVMVSPMAGLKTDEQIETYIAGAIRDLGLQVPIVLQDYPQLTAVHMSASLLNRLFAHHPSLKMLKHEDVPGLRKLAKVRAAEAKGERRRISILVGNSGMFLPQELGRGADGAMTGVAYPEMLVGVCEKFFAGDVEGAADLYDAYLPIVRYENQPGIGLAVRKEILRRRGVIGTAALRAPGAALDADDHKELDGLIARLERRLGDLAQPLRRLRSAG